MRSGRILERVSLPQISRSRPAGRVFSFRDLTERQEAQKRIETLAYTDALTGLPNRLMLSQRVNTVLKTLRRTGGSFSVLFIDLDRFKNINDSMGQAFGNRVLMEAALRISQGLREVDILESRRAAMSSSPFCKSPMPWALKLWRAAFCTSCRCLLWWMR